MATSTIEKGNMQVQRNFKPETAKKLEEFLEVESGKTPTSASQPSRWAEYAKNAPAPLDGASEDILKSSKEIREDFAFKHDLTDDE